MSANAFLVDRFGQQLKSGFNIDPATGIATMVTRDKNGAEVTQVLSGGGGTWGSITGTLSAQDDLNTALAAKVATSSVGAASGVASLDGSTKLPAAQLPSNALVSANVGAANGVAGLDSGGKVPTAQLPAAVLGALNYQSTWNANTNSPALASGVGTKGFFYTVATAGATSLDGISQWNVGDHAVYNGTAWEKIDGIASEVISVAGRTGVITLSVSDVSGAGTVTNTGGNLTSNALVLGAGTADSKVAAGFSTDGTSKITLGVAGTSVGALALNNATSGSVTIHPVTGALGAADWSVPAGTDTFVGLTATQTLQNKTLVAPVLGTPASGTLSNCTGLPVSTGVSGLGTGVATLLATPSSANLAAAMTDETGSGALVFGTGPTISAANMTGVVTTDGANITTANALGALAINTAKGLNTKSISVDSTFTFSGTPATADTWFSLHVTNTDTNPHILTFPSSFSLVSQAARTTCPIPASGQLWLMFRYDGSTYHVFGDGPYVSNYAATVAPAVTDDVAKGYGPGSLWGNATANTLYWCEANTSGAAVWNSIGGAGGTVTNTGGNLTSNALVLGAGTVDTKVVAGIVSDGTSKLTLGVAGTSAGGVVFNNATSGSITFQPATGALGSAVWTVPAVTATLGTMESLVNSQSAAYTTVATDSGKTIFHPAADTTARTWTIDSNANVALAVGTLIAFDNDVGAGVITIAITSDTLVLVGATGSTGNRTLAAGGRAVAQKVTATRWRISGSAELT